MGAKHRLREWLHMGHNESAHSVLPMTSSEDVTSRLSKASFPLPVSGKSPKPGRAPPRKWLHIDVDAKVCCIKVRRGKPDRRLGDVAKTCCTQLSRAQADKHTLVTELDIPYRDLRILDPKV